MSETAMIGIAWNLLKAAQPSPKTGRPNPARQHQIMLIDKYLIVGSGRASGSAMIYRVTHHATHDHARVAALALTAKRERAGYVLHSSPRAMQVTDGAQEHLENLRGFSGPNADLAAAFAQVLLAGHPLENHVSPNEVP